MLIVSGFVLLVWPVTVSGYSCGGGGALVLAGAVEPPDDVFVPERPGADFGSSLSVECDGAALGRVLVSLVPLVLGAVLVVVALGSSRGKRKSTAASEGSVD